jgi:hypothetical protein
MSKNLNLKVARPDDETIHVTWDDPVLAEFSSGEANLWGLLAGGGFIAALVIGIASMDLTIAFIGLAWLIGCLVMFKQPRMVSRSIIFTHDEVIHEGRSYPTELVTRFEYGSRHALTGQAPYSDGKGITHADPTLIRMWIEDASAVELSMNSWQSQVNHKIRDALDRALTTVRQEQVEAERVATYGQQDDKGMPDY